MVLPPLLFNGKVFERLRHPSVSLFLFGQPHGIGFSREITCGLRALTLFTGVLCVVVVGRQWIICCYIVERLIGCGVFSLEFLGFHRSLHIRCQIFFLVGGISWGSICHTVGI